MVSKHLGLIDRPSVPHNLISDQESPFPLPKLQMAPDVNSYVPWVQESNPDILSFSLKKSQQANPLQVPQWGPYGEVCPYPEPFLTYLPGSPVKEPSALSLFREKHSIPRAPFIHLSKSSVDEPRPGSPVGWNNSKRTIDFRFSMVTVTNSPSKLMVTILTTQNLRYKC